MLNDEICKKRDELNESIKNNEDYDKIYKLSVELDELIVKYYMQETVSKEFEKESKKENNIKKKK